ncbi:MAG: type II toxin-antitoxin system RelE/ParE family toxin [Anaerolineae bacterium]|nr:type II toxin-antitoxin system RelE/ParE family toxin [Anaerolineae bacterium]
MSEPYKLTLTDAAIADLSDLERPIAARIVARLKWLTANAIVYPHTALKGQWQGYYRFRAGNYRAIYDLDHETRALTVIVVGHRRDVYDE